MVVEPFQVFTVLLELLTRYDSESLAEVVCELSSYFGILAQASRGHFLSIDKIVQAVKNADDLLVGLNSLPFIVDEVAFDARSVRRSALDCPLVEHELHALECHQHGEVKQ